MKYTKENPLRVVTTFSGYDSQCMGLDRIKDIFPDFEYDLIAWSEIDKYAIQAHNAVYPQYKDRNLGDISKIDWRNVGKIDLLTYSSPCQDWSNAGLQKGGAEGSGTRSSLLWEVRKAIVEKKPKYLLLENVAALVSKKFLPYFDKWRNELESYGYVNFAQLMNAKQYNCPQNRERIFLLSILRTEDDPNPTFHFPEPMKLERRLKDVLEENVDERYYLSDKAINGFLKHNENHMSKGTGFPFQPKSEEDVACCIRANGASAPTDNYIKDKRLRHMIEGNLIEHPKNGNGGKVLIDTYNQSNFHEYSPTIKRVIDQNNNIRIVESDETIEKVGNIYPSNGQNGNIYSANGVSPTISSGQGVTEMV